jgi:hypothetical protein
MTWPGLGRRWGIALAFLAGHLYGASDEVHQMFVPEREADFLDMATDGLGAWVGASLGDSLGASLGGLITGFLSERVGTPNLLFVAAALILTFAIGMPMVWLAAEGVERQRPKAAKPEAISHESTCSGSTSG